MQAKGRKKEKGTPNDVSVRNALQVPEGDDTGHQPVREQKEGSVQGGHVEGLGYRKD